MAAFSSNVVRSALTCLFLAGTVAPVWSADSRNMFTAPNGWNEVSHIGDNNREETHYLPNGQSLGDWSQMITLVKLSDTSEKSLRTLVDKTMRSAMLICKEPPLSRGRFRDGKSMRKGYIAETACDRVDSRAVKKMAPKSGKRLTRIFVTQRDDGIFMLKYVWTHNRLSAKDRLDDPAQLNRFANVISELRRSNR